MDRALRRLAFVSPLESFTTEPILRVDYAHHFHQVSAATLSLSADGLPWAYDPYFCAGYPLGTLFDVDMKLVELLVFALTRLGRGSVRSGTAG